MDDKTIIELFLRRDETAITEVKDKYGKLFYKVSGNILKSEEDMEECINDTLLALWDSIPPEKPLHLSSYLCRILKNFCLNKARYNSAEKRRDSFTLSLEELSECLPDCSTEEEISATELGTAISRFLHSQNPTSRIIFIRRYWYSDSVRDIALRYSINEITVRSHLHRTRKKLKDFLMKEGYYCE